MPAERKREGGVDTRGRFVIGSALMPNIRSAEKRMRADAKRRLRNLEARSKLKTLSRQFSHLIDEKKAAEAKKLYPQLVSLLDRSAKIDVLHRNTASRKKSRLALQLAKLS